MNYDVRLDGADQRAARHLRHRLLLERDVVPEDHRHLPRPLRVVPGVGRPRVAALHLHVAGRLLWVINRVAK